MISHPEASRHTLYTYIPTAILRTSEIPRTLRTQRSGSIDLRHCHQDMGISNLNSQICSVRPPVYLQVVEGEVTYRLAGAFRRVRSRSLACEIWVNNGRHHSTPRHLTDVLYYPRVLRINQYYQEGCRGMPVPWRPIRLQHQSCRYCTLPRAACRKYLSHVVGALTCSGEACILRHH